MLASIFLFIHGFQLNFFTTSQDIAAGKIVSEILAGHKTPKLNPSINCDWLTGIVRVSAQHLIRTDSRDRKLDTFLVSRDSAPQRTAVSAVSSDDTTDFVTTASVADPVSAF